MVQLGTICQLPAGGVDDAGCQVVVDAGCVATAEQLVMVAVAINRTPFEAIVPAATTPALRRQKGGR